ncbi:hypothetical protein C0J52_21921 [Blattella germanica]|nr:hypothetical protein C0J52_21921 [Blattella germanica]
MKIAVLVTEVFERNSVTSFRQAAQLYAQRYPDRRHPANSTFHRLAENLKNHGGFKKTNARNRRHRQLDVVETVRRAVTENPHTSVRAVAADSGICKSVVHDVLKHYLKWRPWKRHTTHKLTPNDFGRRENFCDWIAERMNHAVNAGDDEFLNNILWTDESTFHSNGGINRHNEHHYADDNPHCRKTIHAQGHFSVNVWTGVIGDFVIGPVFLNGP